MFGEEVGNRDVKLIVQWLEEILKPEGTSVDAGEVQGLRPAAPRPAEAGVLKTLLVTRGSPVKEQTGRRPAWDPAHSDREGRRCRDGSLGADLLCDRVMLDEGECAWVGPSPSKLGKRGN